MLIETSGACDISACDERVIRIVDLKTPGSGEESKNDLGNLSRLRMRDEVKFVLTDRADFDWACEMTRHHQLLERVHAVHFSPAFAQPRGAEILGTPGLPLRTLAEWILAEGLGVRLQPQLHKFIWDPQTRGV